MTSSVHISGTGHYVPEHILPNDELEERWDVPSGWISSRTGVCARRQAGEEESTGTMAVQAGKEALRDAGVTPEQVGLLLLATSTPDKPLPPTAPFVQDELNVEAAAFDMAGSCVGFLDALRTGTQFVRSGTHEHVLIIASNHLTYRVNWSDPNTASLFGDGAGAVLLGAPTEQGASGEETSLDLEEMELGSDGSVESLEVPAGGSKEPFTPDAWEADRHLMRMNDGQSVFKLAVRKQVEMGTHVLDRAGLQPQDVDWLLPHQANEKIMRSVTRQLGLSPDQLLSNIDQYGNTSAASIPIMLNEARRRNDITSEDRVLMTAFGCGIRFGAGLITCC